MTQTPTQVADNLKKWNYLIPLGQQNEWWRYFGEYNWIVEQIIKTSKESEVTVVARPLLFLMRHALELGYKGNIVELEKISGLDSNLKFSGKGSHSLEILHQDFERHFKEIVKKYAIDQVVISQFNQLSSSLKELKNIFHQFDAGSYAFRYPFKNDGETPVFEKKDILKIKDIIDLYNTSITILKYTTDVVDEFLPQLNQQ